MTTGEGIVKPTYRAFCFTNLYLSQIQRGIQSAHMLVDLVLSQSEGGKKREVIEIWAHHHKTMIVLNGGFQSELYKLINHFTHPDNKTYPAAYFAEENDALNGALTCVGIILDDRIFESEVRTLGKINTDEITSTSYKHILAKLYMRESNLSWWDVKTSLLLNQYNLA